METSVTNSRIEPMPSKVEQVTSAMFRDQLVINVQIFPDIKEAERLWAKKLGCVKPKYNVIAANPNQDLTQFGLVWRAADRKMFLTRGVVRFSPQVKGNA